MDEGHGNVPVPPPLRSVVEREYEMGSIYIYIYLLVHV